MAVILVRHGETALNAARATAVAMGSPGRMRNMCARALLAASGGGSGCAATYCISLPVIKIGRFSVLLHLSNFFDFLMLRSG